MFDFPNSSAMDATASSGGPGTFLFQIVTGQPQQIAQQSTSLLTKATQFMSMLDEFTKAADQLSTVWSGQASQSAVQKITGSLQSFEKIIQVIQNAAKLLGVSGTLVQTAQTAYRSVVGSVNPTVASLMSNPWTYSAAVALSTATSASLRAFITAIEGLLQALGVGKLGAELAALAGIVMEIEQLAKGTTAVTATSAGSVPTTQTISATPITAPVTPPPVATAAGQQAAQNGITDYTPPALQGYGQPAAPGTGAGAALSQLNGYGVPGTSAATASAGGGTYPSLTDPTVGTGTGLTPSIDPSNSWIAVD
ncbi:MAG TPA: WXG100 family type VII secretion target, partial [Pseudonocardiaceae bacterium]|nr:WXG100 family type VII secretion target [Pseudonocardiaceae bacterium]